MDIERHLRRGKEQEHITLSIDKEIMNEVRPLIKETGLSLSSAVEEFILNLIEDLKFTIKNKEGGKH